jgi:polyvinyl alcohol dehydrogenase (cytochrome)
MKAITGGLSGAILVLASIFCTTGPNGFAAEEAGSAPPSEGACPAAAPDFADPLSAPHWNGWGVEPTQHRFQPADMARLAAADVPRLKLKWAFGFPGASRAYTQPTIVGGRIFVGGQGRKVYSLDAKTGCTYWEFDAGASVRASIVVAKDAATDRAGWLAYFGDDRANVHAVDAVTGKALWTTRIDDHPVARITGSPILVGTTLFVPVSSAEEFRAMDPHYPCCSFRGSVVALQASTGKLLWKSRTIAQEPKAGATSSAGVQLSGPSGAAVWSAPTFDAKRGMIYVTTGDNYSDPPTETSDAVLAFNAVSGDFAWSRQMTAGDAYNMACGLLMAAANCPENKGPDLDFGSPAILADLPDGKRVLIGGQKSGVVTALDPDRGGEIVWQKRVGRGGRLGGVQWGSAADGAKIYVAVSDIKLDTVAVGTPGAQAPAAFPQIALLPDSKAGGGLHALRLDTGEEVWHTPHPGCHDVPGCSPAQSAAVTAIPGIVFSGGLDGHLRAYSADDGRIVWDVDTKGEHPTVNGVAAHGGSIDGPGTVVVDGMIYVSSGSSFYGTIPGNALMAYSVDGR